jgi:non-canonical (house-cleaning) NTP pyrophosphatase
MVEILITDTERQPRQRMFVASKSKIKLDAVSAALVDVDVIAVDSQSNIPEQPMGYEQTLLGAKNRIATARINGATQETTAIENGLVYGRELLFNNIFKDAVDELIEIDAWYDIAFVIMDDEEGHQALQLARAVKVPKYLIEKVLAVGDQSKTMGNFLAEEYENINHQDPHDFLSGGRVNRMQLMKEAIRNADNQLKQLQNSF